MSNKKDIFEILEEFPKIQELNHDILDDAKLLAEKLYGEKEKAKKQKRKIYFRAIMTSLSVCVVFLSVFLPIYFNLPKEESFAYYSSEMVYAESISNIGNFVADNNLNIKYLLGDMGVEENKVSYLIESKTLAFLTQQLLFLSDGGFDKVDLGIVPSNNAFEDFKDFVLLDQHIEIGNISISYRENIINEKTIIKAKFSYENVNYYISIATSNKTGKLDSYVRMLLS